MNFINDLPPVQAVIFFASQALKHHPQTETIEQAIQRGVTKAYNMYMLDKDYDNAQTVDEMKVSDIVAACKVTPGSNLDQEPGDIGNSYDNYCAAKQRRRNGLYH